MPPQVSLGTDPARVGPYQVERKLGAGGMGTVYLARHEQTGQEVAVKVLAPSLAREPGLVARFVREIDALKTLRNPHVVELYDHGVDGEMYYFAMEYVDGETLTARLRREKRIPWREVIDLSSQICVALKAAHDAGIIHRDLKPSNLLLARDGRIKLTDFGVAQVFAGSKLTVTGGIIGTAEYMSPEQGQGGRITKRSDLYSLGAVMYVMLTGRPPFSGKTTLDVIHKHKYNQFDRPRMIVPDIPLWLDEVVCQLMQKDPDKRYADAYVVNRRLQEVLRKVELSSSEMTVGDGIATADSSTVNVGSGVESGAGRAAGSGPGSGTLMRDLFRAEIESQKTPGDFRRFYENVWILLGSLCLLVAAVAYWLSNSRMSPEKRFEAGVALLEADEEANWRTVRDDYFAPLLALQSPEWDEKLSPYMEQIRLDERKADFTAKTRRHGFRKPSAPLSEIERILNVARHQQESGNQAGAERTLTALAFLLEGNPHYDTERKLVDETLQELRNRQAEEALGQPFLDDAFKRADELAAENKLPEAIHIWQSVIDLYGNDPQAAPLVERAKQRIASTSKKKPVTSSQDSR